MNDKLSMVRVSERICDFREEGQVDAYLILGDKRATLVDALMNDVGLAAAVREITDLPVDVLITHGHGDHAGAEVQRLRAAGCDVYMAPADVELLIGMFGAPEEARGWFRPLRDGDVFDLGGLRLEAVFAPGHTPGSAAFFEPEQKWLFSGDTVGSGAFWMQIPGCVPLHEFADSLDALIARVGTDERLRIFPGHRWQSRTQLTGPYLEDVRHITRGILSGEIAGEPVEYSLGDKARKCLKACYGRMENGFWYDPENL